MMWNVPKIAKNTLVVLNVMLMVVSAGWVTFGLVFRLYWEGIRDEMTVHVNDNFTKGTIETIAHVVVGLGAAVLIVGLLGLIATLRGVKKLLILHGICLIILTLTHIGFIVFTVKAIPTNELCCGNYGFCEVVDEHYRYPTDYPLDYPTDYPTGNPADFLEDYPRSKIQKLQDYENSLRHLSFCGDFSHSLECDLSGWINNAGLFIPVSSSFIMLFQILLATAAFKLSHHLHKPPAFDKLPIMSPQDTEKANTLQFPPIVNTEKVLKL